MNPRLLLIGDGRLARHLAVYLEQLGLPFVAWSRRAQTQGAAPQLESLVAESSRALLAISDSAIEPFIAANPALGNTTRVHFSGSLSTPLAFGAHPLFSFAGTLYDRETYGRIPFILDAGGPPLSELIPGLPNPSFFIDPTKRARYHALCVLAGNFTTLLWQKLFFELDWEMDLPRAQALPYLESTLRGLMGSRAPLSGPLSRGDRKTIEKNLEALQGDPFEDVYRSFVTAFEKQGKDWLQP